ncbi:hypothetical protein CPC08DRAFT_661932 [Agrocybe pediades]|nr:hypothetical protein CPC08DRAFT_661932 [Agrocybe pediades]
MPLALSQRTLDDIIWTCSITILACTWVSVHPNMPGINDNKLMVWLRRLELMIWAILAPEMIIFWSLRQWLGARRLAKKYEGSKWSMTHGFFIQMGGLVMAGKSRTEILCPEKLEILTREGAIRFPNIDQEDIQDKSKGDGFSKGMAILQTFWFMAQCLTRKIEGLPITQLEIFTAAFTALNGVMYFLWWDKPLDVRRPMYVEVVDTKTAYFSKLPSIATCLSGNNLYTSRYEERRVNDEFENEVSKETDGELALNGSKHPILSHLSFIFDRLGQMRSFSTTSPSVLSSKEVRMPTFYACAGDATDVVLCHFIVSMIAMAFGAIHCLAWSFQFSSFTEKMLWRICSVIILIIPLVFAIIISLAFIQARTGMRVFSARISKMANLVLPPLYLVARLVLLVEAFLELRHLPSKAFSAVDWTSYIPHL